MKKTIALNLAGKIIIQVLLWAILIYLLYRMSGFNG